MTTLHRMLGWIIRRWDLVRAGVRVPRVTYHMGHAAIATWLTLVFVAFGVRFDLAAVLGAVAYPVLKEIWDYWQHARHDDSQSLIQAAKDGVADLAQHQLLVWPLSYAHQHDYASALIVGAILWSIYLTTLPWSEGYP